MKIIYNILVLTAISFASNAQITITQSDMPHAGDSVQFTNASLFTSVNFNATGANHLWDFSNLVAAVKDTEQFMGVSSTNITYALVFSNLPFNPYRSNVASSTTESPSNPFIPLTNPFNFYYRTASIYKQTGFGAEISGFATPVTLNNQDIIYQLPINFGDTDTSLSDWSVSIPTIGFVGYNQTRINNVDGWGTVITPYATYDALRIKTTRFQKDTIALDTLPPFAIQRPLVTEYKWLANGDVIPVMQITTQTFFGFETVTEIFYREDMVVSLPEKTNSALMHIYPNPTAGNLILELSVYEKLKTVIVENSFGEQVLEFKNLDQQKIILRTQLLAPGIYNLRCITTNGMNCLRFIKQ